MMDVSSIIVLNHGEFGEALIKSAELIFGKIDNINAVSLLEGVSIEEYFLEVKSCIEKAEGNILLLTDIFGGTPNNVALLLQKELDLRIICGINLPMLLEIVSLREHTDDLDKVIQQAYEAGHSGILIPEKITINENKLL